MIPSKDTLIKYTILIGGTILIIFSVVSPTVSFIMWAIVCIFGIISIAGGIKSRDTRIIAYVPYVVIIIYSVISIYRVIISNT